MAHNNFHTNPCVLRERQIQRDRDRDRQTDRQIETETERIRGNRLFRPFRGMPKLSFVLFFNICLSGSSV